VVDDVHELGPEALRQLELLVLRAPPGLRFVMATRHDVRLGLHRLRLEDELAEIREPDLRFTVAEAGELLAAAGVDLPEVALLVERTEGWAAGLRLAALAAAGHPDPGRIAAEFSGTERPADGCTVVGTCMLIPPDVADPHHKSRRRKGERSPHDLCDSWW
jgi:LuxR family transcriptional regulator, maltose regulon positive regulatory protein